MFPMRAMQVERVLLAAGLCRLHHPSPLGTILTPTGQAPAPGRTVHSQQQQQQSQPQPQQQQQQAPLRVRWPRMVLQRLAGMALDWRSEPHLAEGVRVGSSYSGARVHHGFGGVCITHCDTHGTFGPT
jgi:hypothetical protein